MLERKFLSRNKKQIRILLLAHLKTYESKIPCRSIYVPLDYLYSLFQIDVWRLDF